MKKQLDIIGSFAYEGTATDIRPLGNGLINDTFLVQTAGDAPDYVLQRIDGITAENCLVIGDSLSSDIKGANNAGLPCCWYNPKSAPRGDGLRIDHEIRDLRELYHIV